MSTANLADFNYCPCGEKISGEEIFSLDGDLLCGKCFDAELNLMELELGELK